jgi:hypothetical protein
VNTETSRLLDIRATAQYLGGLSTWTVRNFVADGHLRPVKLPSVRHKGENGRRLLFDRRDLDAFIESRRGA